MLWTIDHGPSTQKMKYLIIGLGNIGQEYADTRHNIGFMVLDELAKQENAKYYNMRHAYYAEIPYKGRMLHLVKPTTFMNLSGKAAELLDAGPENTYRKCAGDRR